AKTKTVQRRESNVQQFECMSVFRAAGRHPKDTPNPSVEQLFVTNSRVQLNLLQGRSRVSSPLTPALSPLRGEGVAADAPGGSTGHAAFGHRSDTCCPNAGNEVRCSRIALRAPSPLKGPQRGEGRGEG